MDEKKIATVRSTNAELSNVNYYLKNIFWLSQFHKKGNINKFI